MAPPRWAPPALAPAAGVAVRQSAADLNALAAAPDPLPTYLLLGLVILVVVLAFLSLLADAAKPVPSAREGAQGGKSARGRAVILFFRVAVALAVIASLAPAAFIAFEFLRAGPLSTLAVRPTNEWMHDVMRLSVNAYSNEHGLFGANVSVGVGPSALNPGSYGAERLGWSTVLVLVLAVSAVGAVMGIFAEKLPVTRGVFILMYLQAFVWLLGTLAVAFSRSALLPTDASPLTNKWLDLVYSKKPSFLNETRLLRNWVVQANVNASDGGTRRNTTNLADLPDFRHAFCSQFTAQIPPPPGAAVAESNSTGAVDNPEAAADPVPETTPGAERPVNDAPPAPPVFRGLELPVIVGRQEPSRPDRRPEPAPAPAPAPPTAAAPNAAPKPPAVPAEPGAPATAPAPGGRRPEQPGAAPDPPPRDPAATAAAAPAATVPAKSAPSAAPSAAPAAPPAPRPPPAPAPPVANPDRAPSPVPAPTPPVEWNSSGGPFGNISVPALDRALVSEVFLVYLVGKPIGTDHYRALAYMAVGALVGAPAAIGQLFTSVMLVPFVVLWTFILFLFILFASPTPLRAVAAPRERSEVIEFCGTPYAIWVMDPVTTRIAVIDVVIFALVFVAIVVRGYAWLRVGEKVQEKMEKENVKLVDYDEVYEQESGALRW